MKVYDENDITTNEKHLCRGKRVDNGEWVVGYYIETERCDKTGVEYLIIEREADGSSYLIIPKTVGQCTGRKYANDKLLFEGDIVECYSDYEDTLGYLHTAKYCGVIVWNSNDYCWNIKVNDKLIPFNDYDWDISMVIGNIHDNPELLEIKK